jgi:crotonobetainyl-CoA:carnitine CoA-transferase CaiB-like acyl-CoA transferase
MGNSAPQPDHTEMRATSALGGLRIIDAATALAAPAAATMLADFGADVIKVELPGVGDMTRAHGTVHDGVPLFWAVLARNKRCITLDLRSPEGQDIFVDLAATADVVIENYRPGTFEKWNLSPARLRERNPGLIIARLSGFGQTGPYRSRVAFGTIGEAMSGFAFRNGHPDGPPTLPPFGLADCVAGMITSNAILTALWARSKGAPGQDIDVALVEALLHVLTPQEVEYGATGVQLERQGNRSANNAPRNLYESRDGHWIAISASGAATAARVMELIERPDLAKEPWFEAARGRVEHADEVDGAVATWVRAHDRRMVLQRADELGIPMGPVYSTQDIFEDPHFSARDSITTVTSEDGAQLRMPNVAFRLSATPGEIRWSGPVTLGAHNTEVYHELGLDDKDIERLRTNGVI